MVCSEATESPTVSSFAVCCLIAGEEEGGGRAAISGGRRKSSREKTQVFYKVDLLSSPVLNEDAANEYI